MQSFFNTLFRKKSTLKPPNLKIDVTANLPQIADLEIEEINPVSSPQTTSSSNLPLETSQMIVGVAHSIGLQRDKNEELVIYPHDKPDSQGKNNQLWTIYRR